MTLRPPVSRPDIEQFLQRLGANYRGPARLYLVGGTTLVYEGFCKQTLDIDLIIEVSDEGHSKLIQELRELKEKLNITVDVVSPSDVIPLPPATRNVMSTLAALGKWRFITLIHIVRH